MSHMLHSLESKHTVQQVNWVLWAVFIYLQLSMSLNCSTIGFILFAICECKNRPIHITVYSVCNGLTNKRDILIRLTAVEICIVQSIKHVHSTYFPSLSTLCVCLQLSKFTWKSNDVSADNLSNVII